MSQKIYIINQDIKGFRQGELVISYYIQKYKTKTRVTNNKIIGKWKCCGCPIYQQETIHNKYLEYIDTL